MTPDQDYMFSPELLCLCTNLHSSALRSALNSWKSGISSAQSGMFSLSHVSVKHRTADPRRSVFLQVRRSSSTIFLLRERTFARWIEDSGVQSSFVELYQRASCAVSRRVPQLRLPGAQ
ncbi:hypothetical protein CHARACLAT_033472 [Characodon lateralis]|uniref:Uncharacterized protein n=1 Tax=Characodon lateralis TaxID=208331 RepID=A0ABU7D2U2_9TELE|nr:hypothetical protein [Characodon lateralis]